MLIHDSTTYARTRTSSHSTAIAGPAAVVNCFSTSAKSGTFPGSTTFATIPVMYTGLYCWPILRDSYLLVYTLVSTAVLYALMKSSSKQGRVVALTVQYAFRLTGLIFRLSPWGSGHLSTIWLYLFIEAIAGPAAVVNAFHIPERWFPGKLDYIFNGHGLMHIAAIVCIYFGGQAFLLDMEWLNSGATCL